MSCVIAKDFARIFYRNSFNIGLPIFESAQAAEKITQGDIVEIDADKGVIKNLTKGETYAVKPIPPFMQELVAAGGLLKYAKQKYKIK